jgi:signal transduction histidine kinase
MLSHDLRSLVGNIALSASQAERGGETTDPKWAERVRRSADRMMRLISDTLDLATIERGAFELDRHDREAEALVSDAIDAAWQAARAKEIDIDHDVPADLRVVCDPTRVFQVLLNLLDNAVKFSPERSRIVVTVRPTDRDACFSVSDAGPGIPEDALPHVFDRFWHGRHQRRAGAGLGLAIVKGIVEAHGGRVWVESAEGRGTTFCFTLPIIGEERLTTHDLH